MVIKVFKCGSVDSGSGNLFPGPDWAISGRFPDPESVNDGHFPDPEMAFPDLGPGGFLPNETHGPTAVCPIRDKATHLGGEPG